MKTTNPFLEKYRNWADDEILKIINSPQNYQSEAVEAALSISRERNLLAEDEINNTAYKQFARWYYENKGARKGPVSEYKLKELFENNYIDRDTLIWKEGFADWTKLSQTELSKILPVNSPPPLATTHINNTYVWILAFAPILGNVITGIIVGATHGLDGIDANDDTLFTETGGLWWMTIVLNILLATLDNWQLGKAGHNTKKFGGMWVLLVPVYLFKRASYLKQTPTYAWIWLLCFILSLLF